MCSEKFWFFRGFLLFYCCFLRLGCIYDDFFEHLAILSFLGLTGIYLYYGAEDFYYLGDLENWICILFILYQSWVCRPCFRFGCLDGGNKKWLRSRVKYYII